MKKPVLVSLALVALLAPGLAHAATSTLIAVTGMSDHIEIFVPGAQAVTPNASGHFDFVEVALTGALEGEPYIDASDDRTLKRVQLSTEGTARLRIQLHHGQETTRRIAAATRVVAAADGLHVSVPRKEALATWAPVAVAPAPAPSAVATPIAAKIAPIAAKPNLIMEGPAAPAPPVAEGPMAPAPIAATVASAAPAGASAASATPATSETPATSAAAPLALHGGSPSGPPTSSVLLVLGICGAGLGLVVWARKRKPPAEAEAIRVISSRSLGGKARIVLVAAGERELLLSVSDRGATRLIGRWRRGDTAATGAHASASAAASIDTDEQLTLDPGVDEDRPGPTRQGTRGPSPAVAGILKLRRQDSSPNLAAAAAGVEPDAEWARAMLRSGESDA